MNPLPTTIDGRAATLWIGSSADGPWESAPVEWSAMDFTGHEVAGTVDPVRPFTPSGGWRLRLSGRLTRSGRLTLARLTGLPLRSRKRRRRHRLAMKKRGRL